MGPTATVAALVLERYNVDASYIDGRGFSFNVGNPSPQAAVARSIEKFFHRPNHV